MQNESRHINSIQGQSIGLRDVRVQWVFPTMGSSLLLKYSGKDVFVEGSQALCGEGGIDLTP